MYNSGKNTQDINMQIEDKVSVAKLSLEPMS